MLIIALTLCCMRFFILYPVLRVNEMDLQLKPLFFALLVMSVLFIAAAGYIINDYYDIESDVVNRSSANPKKVVSRRVVIMVYYLLNLLGISGGAVLSIYCGNMVLLMLFIIPAGLLYFYSITYKFQVFVGSIVVSALTAVIPVMAVIFEIPLLNIRYHDILFNAGTSFRPVFLIISLFSGFGFLVSLLRELIKDAADVNGDIIAGKKTLPVVAGMNITKVVICLLASIVIAAILWLFVRFLVIRSDGSVEYYSLFYLFFFILIPLLFSGATVIRAKRRDQYMLAASVIKLVMVTGILYSLVFGFLILQSAG